MPLSVRSPRRVRLCVTLGGLAVAVLGLVLWLVGDTNQVTGANGMDMNSSAAWNDIVDYESDQSDAYEAAREQVDSGESQMTWGVLLGVLGLAAVGSRWLIAPAPAPAERAAAKLTPAQQEQAIAMYLEAQKRAGTEG